MMEHAIPFFHFKLMKKIEGQPQKATILMGLARETPWGRPWEKQWKK